jgi:hypothetical protein
MGKFSRTIGLAGLLVGLSVGIVGAGGAAPPTDWPNWRGPTCSGWVPFDEPLVEDLSRARFLWARRGALHRQHTLSVAVAYCHCSHR